MWDIDSPQARRWLAPLWLTFATVNAVLMYLMPGKETIPYHLIWASFALVYGITVWPRVITWPVFFTVVVVTAIPLLRSAASAIIGWEECSEIVLMAVIAGLLVWHVNRHQGAQRNLAALREEERSRAAKRELATRFGSHEIRTRLTIARGLVDLLADDDATDPLVARDCRLASGELDKATALTNDLMTFVRADDVTLPLLEVDLDELVSEACVRWSAGADRDWVIRTDAGMQLCDPERFEAAVDCLVENAVKFTEPGDRIFVRTAVEGSTLILTVSDSGAGIAAEDLDRVTELFQTGTRAGDRAGNGLGLAIVRALAESRGGTLQVTSALGRGTTVTVRMPGRSRDRVRVNAAAAAAVRSAPHRHSHAPAQHRSGRELLPEG